MQEAFYISWLDNPRSVRHYHGSGGRPRISGSTPDLGALNQATRIKRLQRDDINVTYGDGDLTRQLLPVQACR